MEIIFLITVFIILIGIKLAVLLYVLNRDKKKQLTPHDEDILDS